MTLKSLQNEAKNILTLNPHKTLIEKYTQRGISRPHSSQKKIENIYRKFPILFSPICHCPCPASTAPTAPMFLHSQHSAKTPIQTPRKTQSTKIK